MTPRKLPVDEKFMKIAFYTILAVIIFTCILLMLSIVYAGSFNPADIISRKNFTFSYAGTPAYTYIYIDNVNIGLIGVNGSMCNLTLRNESNMKLYPQGGLNLIMSDGTRRHVGDMGKGPYDVSCKNATVSIMMIQKDDVYYNMRLEYERPDMGTKSSDVTDLTGNVLKLIKKPDDQYLINSSFLAPGRKTFEVTDNPGRPLPILIQCDDASIKGTEMYDVRSIEYTGRIILSADDEFVMNLPVMSMSQAGADRVLLKMAEGILVIQRNVVQANPADDISIYTAEDSDIGMASRDRTYVRLLNGQIIAYGFADSLVLRGQDYGQPIGVIVKEGNIAIFIGLLSSVLTVVLSRLISSFKKK